MTDNTKAGKKVLTAKPRRQDLITAEDGLINGILHRFSDLTANDAQIIASAVISEVATHIGRGDDVAFVQMNSDGTAELTVLSLRKIDETTQGSSKAIKPMTSKGQ